MASWTSLDDYAKNQQYDFLRPSEFFDPMKSYVTIFVFHGWEMGVPYVETETGDLSAQYPTKEWFVNTGCQGFNDDLHDS